MIHIFQCGFFTHSLMMHNRYRYSLCLDFGPFTGNWDDFFAHSQAEKLMYGPQVLIKIASSVIIVILNA